MNFDVAPRGAYFMDFSVCGIRIFHAFEIINEVFGALLMFFSCDEKTYPILYFHVTFINLCVDLVRM